jgi:hypothetical protein
MIDTQTACELFDYKEGQLFWKKKSNKRHSIDAPAGTVNASGYRVITWGGKKLHAHRVIWVWHGKELPRQIDHINRNPLDNRIENLRAADVSNNGCNVGIKSNNRSGAKNVSWCNTAKRWVVQVWKNDRKYGTTTKDFDKAVSIAADLRQKLHGEFAYSGAPL